MACSFRIIMEPLPENRLMEMCDFLKPVINSQISTSFFLMGLVGDIVRRTEQEEEKTVYIGIAD